MKNKLIIVSGGMDSITLLYKERMNIKQAISFYYGQKHTKELQYAQLNCDELGIPWELIDLSIVGSYLKSNLLQSGGAIPEGHYEDESMKQTVVPFRNGIMLSIACGIAESHDCSSILIGAHAGDHAIYPDCRSTFLAAMSAATHFGTYNRIEIEPPFLNMDKREIGLIGQALGVDYSKTWTCYKGKEKHCGKCGACTERKEALEGFDPTEYETE